MWGRRGGRPAPDAVEVDAHFHEGCTLPNLFPPSLTPASQPNQTATQAVTHPLGKSRVPQNWLVQQDKPATCGDEPTVLLSSWLVAPCCADNYLGEVCGAKGGVWRECRPAPNAVDVDAHFHEGCTRTRNGESASSVPLIFAFWDLGFGVGGWDLKVGVWG